MTSLFMTPLTHLSTLLRQVRRRVTAPEGRGDVSALTAWLALTDTHDRQSERRWLVAHPALFTQCTEDALRAQLDPHDLGANSQLLRDRLAIVQYVRARVRPGKFVRAQVSSCAPRRRS